MTDAVMPRPAAPMPDRVRAYVALTKPRIVELLLVTTVPSMIVAAEGWPGTALVLATVIGGTLSAAGANVINNVVDRDIDALMHRTRRRPLPTARVTPIAALRFGVALGVAGFVWLWLLTNLLAATLATAGLLFYVFVYTIYLKRRSPQNIVIGGAAGAVPSLVGWAAVTGTVGLPAWIMFAVVFFWTPPHFWALALRYRDDYAAAGIPMLPVVVGVERTLEQSRWYAVATVAASLVLFPARAGGLLVLGSAIGLGVALLVAMQRLIRRPAYAMRFFGLTNLYLAALFGVIAIDGLV